MRFSSIYLMYANCIIILIIFAISCNLKNFLHNTYLINDMAFPNRNLTLSNFPQSGINLLPDEFRLNIKLGFLNYNYSYN